MFVFPTSEKDLPSLRSTAIFGAVFGACVEGLNSYMSQVEVGRISRTKLLLRGSLFGCAAMLVLHRLSTAQWQKVNREREERERFKEQLRRDLDTPGAITPFDPAAYRAKLASGNIPAEERSMGRPVC
jgi:hypothetical protein